MRECVNDELSFFMKNPLNFFFFAKTTWVELVTHQKLIFFSVLLHWNIEQFKKKEFYVKLSILSYRKWKLKVVRTSDLRTKDMFSNPALVVHTEPSSQPLYNP